jgi:hypothetical protein
VPSACSGSSLLTHILTSDRVYMPTCSARGEARARQAAASSKRLQSADTAVERPNISTGYNASIEFNGSSGRNGHSLFTHWNPIEILVTRLHRHRPGMLRIESPNALLHGPKHRLLSVSVCFTHTGRRPQRVVEDQIASAYRLVEPVVEVGANIAD